MNILVCCVIKFDATRSCLGYCGYPGYPVVTQYPGSHDRLTSRGARPPRGVINIFMTVMTINFKRMQYSWVTVITRAIVISTFDSYDH